MPDKGGSGGLDTEWVVLSAPKWKVAKEFIIQSTLISIKTALI